MTNVGRVRINSRLKILIYSFILQFVLLHSVFAQQINHIEYGATNHAGQNPIFEQESGFLGLKQSLQELLLTHENSGRIYLNDLDEKGLVKAASFLQAQLNSKGIETQILNYGEEGSFLPKTGIEIVLLPGNFLNFKLPKTRTAHLRNPAPFVLQNLMGDKGSEPSSSRLGEMVAAASKGLRLISRQYRILLGERQYQFALDSIQQEFSRAAFVIKKTQIPEVYHDFSITGGMFGINQWSDGGVINGDYYELLLTPKASLSCKKALIGF